jgi:hypothetical protein
MTLADRRKVIEVLLCCGQNPCAEFMQETTDTTARSIVVSKHIAVGAHRQWLSTRRSTDGWPPHAEICITAAYRLIESSPTLRREWFGAR